MCFYCAPTRNKFAIGILFIKQLGKQKIFPVPHRILICLQMRFVARNLLMVGPDTCDRKILRETDGERFVLLTKGRTFQGEFANCEKENLLKEMYLTIKNSLYVISYPLARELFAFRKNRCAAFEGMNLHDVSNGPLKIELGVAKTFLITIMRLPRWKR